MLAEIDYGTRLCKICGQQVSVGKFGRHVVDHGEDRIVREWPGGLKGYLQSLEESLEESIRRAGDHEPDRTHLTRSLTQIREYIKKV